MFLLAGFGGMFGACSRLVLGAYVNKKAKKVSPFPAGTWIINITGSFLLGLLAQLHMNGMLSENLWLFLGTGFCGAYTTFSTFGTETVGLIQTKQFRLALLYVASSLILSLAAALIGYSI